MLASAGTLTSTTVAHVSNLDFSALRNGLWGYNGCLIGCATAVFISPLTSVDLSLPLVQTAAASGLVTTIVGGTIAPFISAALKPAMGNVPQWTLTFNLVTLGILLRTKPFLNNSSTEHTSLPSMVNIDPMVVLNAPLKGISQIWVVESSLSGLALLGGIYLYSPGLAGHAFLGSSIGALSGAAMIGSDFGDIEIGLYGFNSCLTALGVGVFFVHSPRAVLL
eukprot:CAMPEP_0194441454 /NCGR_PEP_ID=MMETSP0176-20130528/121748_1 /TAXON_ID=216777 /ORGANISM="Proboscia alata, Strain PI-D3" /LENGTH=221 /DNA_ID=CAMNT_0039266839 /DNA_START=393 /DNA_END=1054 /DNA_ORIENTATION=+